jgi:hypothetical protein
VTADAFDEMAAAFAKAAVHRHGFALEKKLFGFRQRPGWGALRQQGLALFKAARRAMRVHGNRADALVRSMDWSLPTEYSSMRIWRPAGAHILREILPEAPRSSLPSVEPAEAAKADLGSTEKRGRAAIPGFGTSLAATLQAAAHKPRRSKWRAGDGS